MALEAIREQHILVDRDESGAIVALNRDIRHPNRELLLYAEVDRLADADLPELEERLRVTTNDLEAVVGDFAAMKARLRLISFNKTFSFQWLQDIRH